MKKLFLTFLLSVTGWSASYDPFLLDTQLSLLPKIALLEKSLAALPSKTPVRILVVHDRSDEDTARSCSRLLMNKFNGHLNGRPISVSRLSFDKLDGAGSYHLVYALKASITQLKKLHNAVNSSGALTALYDGDKIRESDLFLSVQMERTPVILINAKILRENRFSFPDSLLEMARIVE